MKTNGTPLEYFFPHVTCNKIESLFDTGCMEEFVELVSHYMPEESAWEEKSLSKSSKGLPSNKTMFKRSVAIYGAESKKNNFITDYLAPDQIRSGALFLKSKIFKAKGELLGFPQAL